jgi:hypothetical protein
MTWKPDIAYLTRDNFSSLLPLESAGDNFIHANQLIDMIAHKKPSLKVMEVNVSLDDQTSIWLDEGDFDEASRAASKEYHFVTSDATVLMNVQERNKDQANAKFSVLNLARPPTELSLGTAAYDLIIVKTVRLYTKIQAQ